MKKLFLTGLTLTLCMSLFVVSCDSDDSGTTFPLTADIISVIDDKQVAFQGISRSATNWLWDFGDGNTSNEQNPVHVYENGGYYTVIFTAIGENGETVVEEVELEVALTPYVLLTGGLTAINGKTWKLSASHTSNGDYFAFADSDFSIVDPTVTPLPDEVFSSIFGFGEIYDDEYTFYFDGVFKVDLKEDEAALGGIVYQLTTSGFDNITNFHPEFSEQFGLIVAKPFLEEDLSFTYVAEEDFLTSSVWTGGAITYEGVSTLSFSKNGFFGFIDFERKVLVQEITDATMKVIVFMAASQDQVGINTHALVLTFEVVN